MVNYVCQRCGYKTSMKYNFRKHLFKKTTCPPTNVNMTITDVRTHWGIEHVTIRQRNVNKTSMVKSSNIDVDFDDKHICTYCHRTFKTRQAKHQHQNRYCKFKTLSNPNDKQKIEELTTQVHSLLQMLMETSTDKPKHITNNNQITNNNNNLTNNLTNNITNTNTNNTQLQINNQINNYGNEDTSYITKEKYKEILKNPFTSLSKLINEVHFNDEHPENKNMRIPNKKQPFIEFYDDGWVIGNQYKFVCKLFFIKKELLHEAYLEVEDILDEKTKEAYRHFREETTLNPKTVESQLKDIQAAIMSGTRKRMEYLQQHPPTT